MKLASKVALASVVFSQLWQATAAVPIISKGGGGVDSPNALLVDSDNDDSRSTGLGQQRELQSSSSILPFDIVFVVDESGSMSDEQDAIRTNTQTLFSSLTTAAPGSRVGLVGYGADAGDVFHVTLPDDEAHLHTALTDDASVFSTAAQSLVADGGTEPSYQAVIDILKEVLTSGGLPMGYTLNRPFCVVLFTDEDSDGPAQLSDVIAYLQNSNPPTNQANAKGTFFGVTPTGVATAYQPIATATGGDMLDLNAFVNDPVMLFLDILTHCSAAANRITLNPTDAGLTLGDIHTLTITTNQLNPSTGNVEPTDEGVVLQVLNGPDAGDTFPLTTSAGVITQAYNPLVNNPTYLGGTINFRACLASDPTTCSADVSATFCNPAACADQCNAGVCQIGVCVQVPIDTDGDGTLDCNDGCPQDADKVAPGVCGCGVADTDSDGDGTPDCNDGCPQDADKVVAGDCGCGNPDTDSDGDGTPDCNDGCPQDAGKVVAGDCGCGNPDTDSDGDGTPDCNDGCPQDAGKVAPGVCGCGVADTDSDGDGTLDCNDDCAADALKSAPGICGCNVPDTDSDGDGTPDCNDDCAQDADKVAPGVCGCGVQDTDSDGDGTPDCNDDCAQDAGKVAPGVCGCGVADTDSDGDGTPDCNDDCAQDADKVAPGVCGCGNPDTDSDGDGMPDCNDLCAADAGKVAPGVCGCGVADTDSDGDGTPDCNDECDADAGKVVAGFCGCGVPDTNSDGDGEPDCNDGCPQDAGKVAPGVCGCGVPDIDSDGDGTLDCNDGCPQDAGKVAPGVCGCGVADIDSDGDGTLDCLVGTLVIIVDGGPQPVDFTITPSVGDPINTAVVEGTPGSIPVPPGDTTIFVTVPPGLVLVDASCVDAAGASTGTLNPGVGITGAEITLNAVTTCMFEFTVCINDATGDGIDTGCSDETPICNGAAIGDTGTACNFCINDMTGDGIDTGCSAATPLCNGAAIGDAGTACEVCIDDQTGATPDTGCLANAPLCIDGEDGSASCNFCINDMTGDGIDTGCSAATPLCNGAAIGDAGTACEVCIDDQTGATPDTGCSANAPLCIDGEDGSASCNFCINDMTGDGIDTGCSAATPLCNGVAIGDAGTACDAPTPTAAPVDAPIGGEEFPTAAPIDTTQQPNLIFAILTAVGAAIAGLIAFLVALIFGGGSSDDSGSSKSGSSKSSKSSDGEFEVEVESVLDRLLF